MQAIDSLKDDHRIIERVLAVLATATVQMERGGAVRPGLFLGVVEFLEGFVHAQHFRREEGALFSALEGAGVIRQAGPLGAALREHEESRSRTRALRMATERWARDEGSEHGDVAEAARACVSLLKQHIAREEQLIFPMAMDLIPAQDHFQLLDDLTEIGAHASPSETPEWFGALVAALEEEVTH